MPSPLVVVVEDDLGSRTSLGRVLLVGGFEIAMYASAEEFLNSRPTSIPICLILDIQLGGQSGLDLQRLLNAEGSRVPFIVVTALDNDRVRDEAEALGCLAYFRKPCEGHAILALLRTLR